MIKVQVGAPLGAEMDKNKFDAYLTVELELAGATLGGVIEQMTRRYGRKVKEELLDEAGDLDFAYGVFCNGERMADLTEPIPDGAEVVIDMMGSVH